MVVARISSEIKYIKHLTALSNKQEALHKQQLLLTQTPDVHLCLLSLSALPRRKTVGNKLHPLPSSTSPDNTLSQDHELQDEPWITDKSLGREMLVDKLSKMLSSNIKPRRQKSDKDKVISESESPWPCTPSQSRKPPSQMVLHGTPERGIQGGVDAFCLQNFPFNHQKLSLRDRK